MNYNLKTCIITLNKNIDDFSDSDVLSLNPKIIKGVDGRKLNKTNNFNSINLSYFNYQYLPKTVIGCALSHIKCWKSHILNNNNYTLILEDDFFISDKEKKDILLLKKMGINMADIIKIFIHNTPKDFDILYLGYISGSFIKKYFNTIGSLSNYKKINQFIAKPDIALGLHSYIISDSGVVKLLNNIQNNKINFHIDTYIQSLTSKNIINSYITIPRIFYQSSTYKDKSLLSSSFKCPLFKNIFIDNYVSLNYVTNVSLFSIMDYDFSIWIIFIIIINFIILKKIIIKLAKEFRYVNLSK
jgi:GR25 family glycosyltransferase involved in LPS biosynthesis